MKVYNLFLVAIVVMSVLSVGCVNDDSSRFQKNQNVSDQVYQSQHTVAPTPVVSKTTLPSPKSTLVNQDDEFYTDVAKALARLKGPEKSMTEGLRNNMPNKVKMYSSEFKGYITEYKQKIKQLNLVKYGPERDMFIEALDYGTKWANLMELSGAASNSGNYEDATKYLTEAVRISEDEMTPRFTKVNDGFYK